MTLEAPLPIFISELFFQIINSSIMNAVVGEELLRYHNVFQTKEKAVTSASVSSKLPKHDDGDELVKTTTNQCSDQPPADNNNGIENAMDKLSIIEVELNKNRFIFMLELQIAE